MFERISLKLHLLLTELRREDGQGATEYAMVIGFLIVGLTIGLAALGLGINSFLEEVAAALGGLIP
jgi:Flp pilus assembly pilin Flp